MNTRSISILVLAALLGLAVRGHTQAPGPKTPVQMLQAMKVQNQALLEKQTALMTKLDDGPSGLFDGDGSAVIVHASPDQFTTNYITKLLGRRDYLNGVRSTPP